MRTGLDKAIDSLVKSGVSTEDIIAWCNDNLTTKELTEHLVKTLKENYELKEEMPGMIRISQTDFDRHFRIIGLRSDGTPENRGSKRWNKDE